MNFEDYGAELVEEPEGTRWCQKCDRKLETDSERYNRFHWECLDEAARWGDEESGKGGLYGYGY